MTGFVLETARLLLRELSPDDADALSEVLSDPVAMRHYPQPFTPELVADWIERNRVRYREEVFGLWAAILRSDGALIGDCGLTVQEVEGVPEVEVGYHIVRRLWGRGYATEAAQACRDLAFESFGVQRLIALVLPANTQSRRVAEKLGMRVEKQVERRGGTHLVYVLERPT